MNENPFEREMLPHLGAAYGLALWLTRSAPDAEDLVQDAYLRAWKAFQDFRGKNGKAWLLAIVRNGCYTWLKSHRAEQLQTSFDETLHDGGHAEENPENLLSRTREVSVLRRAVEALPPEFREVIVLREWQGLSYKEISEIADIPLGTVMSRLVRARNHLHKSLTGRSDGRT